MTSRQMDEGIISRTGLADRGVSFHMGSLLEEIPMHKLWKDVSVPSIWDLFWGLMQQVLGLLGENFGG